MDFIDLREKPSKSEMAGPSQPSQPYYPSFHVSNKNLPIDISDVGQTITAMVKLKVNSIEKRATKDKKTYSCSFDVLGINFNKKKIAGDLSKLNSSDLDELEHEEFTLGEAKKKRKGLYAL